MQTSSTHQNLQNALSQDAFHAIALFRNGKPLDGIAYLESSLSESENSADYALLSDFYHALQNMPKALSAIKYAWELDPYNIAVQLKLVNLFLEAESYEFCKECLEKIDPDQYESEIQFEYFCLYAKVLQKLKNYQCAFEKGQKALVIKDNVFEINLLLGDITYQLSHFENSKNYFEKALLINPSDPVALNYFSILNHALGLERESIWFYLKLLRLQADLDGIKFNLSCTLLALGKYDLGLHFYEDRDVLEKENLNSIIQPRIWQGESLQDKSLLVYSEQGCGDNLQFCRFLKDLKSKYNCTIIYVVRDLNFKITQSLSEDIVFLNEKDVKEGRIILPKCDFATPLMSILKYLKVREPSYQLSAPYLHPSQDRIDHYKKKIAELNLSSHLKVGLLWAGNKEYGNDRNRSFDASKFDPLFDCDDIAFFKLQVNEKKHDLDHQPIHTLLPEDPDFNESAALIEHLDLVITVDTSIAHLAGALFKPVYCLVHKDPDWRWGGNDQKTNWYPSMTLFKQKTFGDWDEVICRVLDKLKTF